MHKFCKILLCLLLCLSLFGCSYQSNFDNTAATKTTASQNHVTQSVDNLTSAVNTTVSAKQTSKQKPSSTKRKKEPKKEKSTTKFTKNSKKTTKSSNTSVITSTHEIKTTADLSQTTASALITEEQKSTSVTAASGTTAVTQETAAASVITCEVTVECTALLSNMDKLKKGHEAYVPSDGIIINTYALTLSSGATAYDAIAAACSDNAVKITESSDGFGKYIIGFNNIDEKDCGPQSGWVYKVNGFKPMKSCNKYKLQNGDTVLFSYTCSY